jgi:hypothetical protein
LADNANFNNKVNDEFNWTNLSLFGNQIALAVCTCGKIHCIGEEELSTCPWCESQSTYVAAMVVLK